MIDDSQFPVISTSNAPAIWFAVSRQTGASGYQRIGSYNDHQHELRPDVLRRCVTRLAW